MRYKNENLITFKDIFNVALDLAKNNKSEAEQFFKEYVNYIYLNNDKVNSLTEAEKNCKI